MDHLLGDCDCLVCKYKRRKQRIEDILAGIALIVILILCVFL